MTGNSDGPQLRLLTVHAHPDDEASKGASTVAACAARDVHCVLVCCTGGEAGDILNPAMDRPEVRENLPEVRAEELDRAASIIGYHEVVMLGYHDSGMADDEHNAHPEAFANADLDEAVGRLVAVIRRVRPHVIVTYPDERRGYKHPDHLQVHDISLPAFEAAGEPGRFPEAGEPWQPLKLYFTTWSRARIERLHAMFGELGLESPYGDWWFERPSHDHLITTKVPIREHWQARCDALRAHATQIDPASPFWFGLPDDVAGDAYPWDDYVLAETLVGGPPEGELETDLFDRIRGLAEAEVDALARRHAVGEGT
ncbi:MAG: mycothiol conjugate amidase Mca [Acidimicrobiales bacterium]|nr:mycothiol conjugate amidase Mca [Acidimicrobiales bacterium]